MAYATIADVERLDGAITYNAQTPVTTLDVTGFLVRTSAELDGVLAAQDYSVPVSPTAAPISFQLLTHYNALGGDAYAQNAWPDSPRKKDAMDLWLAALKMLKDGDVALPDAPADSAGLQLRVRTGFPDSSPTPFFFRDMAL